MQSYFTILLLSSLISDTLAHPSNRLLKRDGEESRQLSEEGKEMICRLNALRRENGKKDILLDYRVMAAAQKHAEAMKQNDNLTHDGFTPETKGFIDRVHLEGYTGGAGAENICQGSGNVVDVLTCWKNSPGHLENMLSDNECFGYGRDDFFWVQDFVSGDKCQGYGDVDCTKFGL